MSHYWVLDQDKHCDRIKLVCHTGGQITMITVGMLQRAPEYHTDGLLDSGDDKVHHCKSQVIISSGNIGQTSANTGSALLIFLDMKAQKCSN